MCDDKSGLGYSHSNTQTSTSKTPSFYSWKYNERYASKFSTPSYGFYALSHFPFMPQKNDFSFIPHAIFRKYVRPKNNFVKHDMPTFNFHLTYNYCGVF